MVSFFDIGAEARLGQDNKLVKLSRLLNWEKIERALSKVHERDNKEVCHGGFSYNKLKMYKALLLKEWHSLSDPGLEEALRVRLDFMKFTGFSLDEEIPDETTLCRFRNKLIDKGLDRKLLQEVNNQLEALVLKLEKAKAAVVDATIIESAARARRILEISEDRNEEDALPNNPEVTNYKAQESCDPDAKWLKKGGKSYFGYKGFVTVDDGGFITNMHVTSANKPEVKEFSNILPHINAERAMADKGYASHKNREALKNKGIKDGIMHKAYKNRPLTRWQRLFNKLVSKTRYIIEQCFGTLKRRFKFERASYIGLKKVTGQLAFKAMCYNLLKAVNMVKFA